MGLFDFLSTRRKPRLADARAWASTGQWWPAGESHAGVDVTPETAMAASAVYACVGVIADAMASLPVHVTERTARAPRDDHPAARLLAGQPNPEMTAADFRRATMANLLLWGNGYAYVERDRTGVAAALWPLRSAATHPVREPGGSVTYRAVLDGKTFDLAAADVLHLKAATLDGVTGISPIGQVSNAIGLSLAMEKYAGKFFSNGAHTGGIVGLPAAMKPAAVDAFKASWKANFSGPDNSFRTALLTDGMTYTKTGTDPEAAQMLDSRVFQVREIARIYRVPLHMIGDLERATFSNIEHQGIEFAQHTVMPWAVRWEQEAAAKLFTPAERSTLELRFNLDSLLRADTAARYAAYNAGRQGGWLSVNDIRRKEGLPPIDGGDEFLKPLNMTPAGDQKAGT